MGRQSLLSRFRICERFRKLCVVRALRIYWREVDNALVIRWSISDEKYRKSECNATLPRQAKWSSRSRPSEDLPPLWRVFTSRAEERSPQTRTPISEPCFWARPRDGGWDCHCTLYIGCYLPQWKEGQVSVFVSLGSSQITERSQPLNPLFPCYCCELPHSPTHTQFPSPVGHCITLNLFKIHCLS